MNLSPKFIFGLGLLFSFLDVGITLIAFQLGFHELSPYLRIGLDGPSLFFLEPLVILGLQGFFIYLSMRWNVGIGQYLALGMVVFPFLGFSYDLTRLI